MAVYKGNSIPPFTGTKYGICIYKRAGQYCLRAKSSLTGKRVKKDPKFRRTMQYAEWLGDASRIASAIYRTLPSSQKHFPFFRTLTGEAMQLLKAGKTVPEAERIMWNNYVEKKTETKQTQQPVNKAGVKSIKRIITAQQNREHFNLQRYCIPQGITGTARKNNRGRKIGSFTIHPPPIKARILKSEFRKEDHFRASDFRLQISDFGPPISSKIYESGHCSRIVR